MILSAKPAWVRDDSQNGEAQHQEYPTASLDAWHRAPGLLED